ncbi:MAG TPA: CdaR family protein [Thermomicrobiales bacterium]|nr:CdaR family protein [Thermomicrobiales bacterium]
MGHRIRRIISAGTFVRLAVSILLAFIIWGFIVWETNPEITRNFPTIPVTARDVPGNMLVVGNLPTVSVTLKGPQSEMRSVVASDLTAWVDFSSAEGPGIDEYPVRVAAPDGARKIIVEPPRIEVELDLIVTETFQVVIREDEPRPANVANIELSTELVSIQGPEDLVSRVEAVEVPVEIGGRSESFSEQVEPVPVDAMGNPVPGVTVSPATITLSVTFESTSKDVPVQVICACVVDNRVQEIELATASPIPSTIRLSGPAADLAEIDVVRTTPIDISVLSESGWILNVELDLTDIPQTVTVPERAIDVWVPVEPTRRELRDVPIAVIGLGSGLEASLAEQTVSIVIIGGTEIDTLELEQRVTGVVDLRGLAPGTYSVDVGVVVPPGLTYEQVQPESVRVVIQPVAASQARPGDFEEQFFTREGLSLDRY